MRSRPTWLRATAVALLGASFVALIAALILYFQITAAVQPSSEPPNNFDAKEATRKLRIFEEALKTTHQGFVRISEPEFNSWVHENFFGPNLPQGSTPGARFHVLRSRAEFRPGGLALFELVEAKVGRWPVQFLWIREGALEHAGARSEVHLSGMRLGRLKVPQRAWDWVSAKLAPADGRFRERFDWLMNLPTLEYATNENSRAPELRLYTYPVADRK